MPCDHSSPCIKSCRRHKYRRASSVMLPIVQIIWLSSSSDCLSLAAHRKDLYVQYNASGDEQTLESPYSVCWDAESSMMTCLNFIVTERRYYIIQNNSL